MDSGNSSSMQSSSGGDEEYDSQAESVPAFLNTSGGHFGSLSNPHQSHTLVSQHHDHTPAFFDPSANYLNPFSQSQPNSSLLNLDGVRPRSLRSEPNSTDLGNLTGSSSSTQSVLGAQGLNRASFPSSSSMQSRPSHDNGVRSLTQSDQTTAVRNPKKRTRASRRAPTTVLTTDTTNFRAMVQEFTGIPAPPFSGSSYSRRLDLFGSSSGMRSGHLEPIGSLYPLRPSAKRIQPTPFLPSSSPSLNNPLVDAANITNTTSNSTIPTSIAATTNAFNPTSSNYQLPSDLGLLKQPQNLLNLQNQSPVLSFQSFLQPPPSLHPSLNLSGFGVKSQGSSAMPSLDELGLSHGHFNANLGGIQNHVTPDGVRLRSESNWRDGGRLNDENQDHLRPLDGNYGTTTDHNSHRANSCKLNYSASSSEFHHDKGLDNASSRAEGTVDSWICPAE